MPLPRTENLESSDYGTQTMTLGTTLHRQVQALHDIMLPKSASILY